MNGAPPRAIRLCADDYGISPAVNRGIRALIARGRLNATSVMVPGPASGPAEMTALRDVTADHPNFEVGLHVTLTAPFRPLTPQFAPLVDGGFPPLPQMLKLALLRRLDPASIRDEILAQIAAFVGAWGRAPDYLDGHQHVQLFPQVADAFLEAAKSAAPAAWVRQCGRARDHMQRLAAPKALLLDVLSAGFRTKASRAGIAFNPAFAGAYDFGAGADFATLMRGFLDGLLDGGLVMCHPGFVDDTLRALDPLTDQRVREHDYLASQAFADLLAQQNVALR